MSSTPLSPASRKGSPTNHGSVNSSRRNVATPSFFIIQEPASLSGLVSQPSGSSPSSRGQAREKEDNGVLTEHSSTPVSPALGTAGSPLARRRERATSAVVQEETDADMEESDHPQQPSNPTPTTVHISKGFAILNRIGSSPELPLYNAQSSSVYSSTRKRQLLKPSTGTGAGTHLASLQRSRLIPLPINIRSGALKKDSGDGRRSPSPSSLRDEPEQDEEKMNYQITIGSLKERIACLEKQLVSAAKKTHGLETQVDGLGRDKQRLQTETTLLSRKSEELDHLYRQQRHAFDKLTERYATVYGNLEKLAEAGTTSSDSSVHVVIQALTRENQDLQRKVRVLEARHHDDKLLVSNQEKKIKRMRAEMEALQHMNDHHVSEGAGAGSVVRAESPQSQPLPQSPTVAASSERASSPSSAESLVSSTSRSPTPLLQQHRMASEDCQYIDPNILKVLEKVDSQFSITTAINLSVVLKKWLHSCLHVVASTDLASVLQHHLQRVCELLHCQHAAVFTIDHRQRRAVARVCERGPVHWELPLDKGILGASVAHTVLCNVKKAYDDPRFYSASDSITGTKSREVLCIPITNELEALQPTSVVAVLQVWNTTNQKPFTTNDQIIGGLVAIQAGTVVLQTTLSDNMQRVNKRVLQLTRMHDEIVAKTPSLLQGSLGDGVEQEGGGGGTVEPRDKIVSLVRLVHTSQKQFAEILGISKLRIYVFDADVMRIWHVGARLDATTSTNAQLVPIRKYATAASSICALLLGMDPRDEDHTSRTGQCRIVADPTAEPTFNDTVDLKGGANGLYLAPIRSPWREMPLGMIQVARTATALGSIEGHAGTAIIKEKLHAQRVDDALTMELIELFCHEFGSLLHHAMAFHVHETCPVEVQDARLAYLTDRLEALEVEYLREQEEAEAEAEANALANARMQERLLETVQKSRPASAAPVALALISTESMYEIDLSNVNGAAHSLESRSNSSRSLTSRTDELIQ